MGDAAHSMVNHMAQGAATAMEDGAFLAKCVGKAIEGKISLAEAIEVYEQERIPKAYMKQQVSFLNGAIWHLPDGPQQRARDEAMKAELSGEYYVRSSNLYGDPQTVLEVYGYDAEGHAESTLAKYINRGREPADLQTKITPEAFEKYVGWFTDKSKSNAGQHIAQEPLQLSGRL
jgi:salicylate hydroxylase